MDEWLKLPLVQLKRLVKSRAGRIAELQMEIKIIEGIIESKIREGDLRYLNEKNPAKPKGKEPRKETAPEPEPDKEEPKPAEEKKDLTKDIKPSSNHSFEEIE